MPASSTALSMAGCAASTSPRSTGTRIVLNMSVSPDRAFSGAVDPVRHQKMRHDDKSLLPCPEEALALTGGSVNDEPVEFGPDADLAREPRIGAHIKSEVEHVFLHGLRLARRGFPFFRDIDVTGGAGAGPTAFRLDTRNAVADGSFHDGCALLRLDGAGRAFGIDERNIDHCGPLLVGAYL